MPIRAKRRVVIASNRGPVRSVGTRGKRRWERSAGGLVAALDPVLRQRGGVWVSAQDATEHSTEVIPDPDLGYDNITVRIPRGDQDGFYQGVSNALLWPLLHSLPPTVRVGEAPWKNYVSVNTVFAEAILAASASRDLVWVHDYHLMLVPRMLRRHRRRSRIGWFCHVPWPGPELFSILPWRTDVIEGLLGANVIGFHAPSYADNFLACVARLTDCRVDARRRIIQSTSGTTHVVVAPIGVPTKELTELSLRDEVGTDAARIRHSVGNRRIIIGVDRLDYTKGIPERILGYERLLRRDRHARRHVVLVQVMVPSRTDVSAYATLKAEIDRLVGSVNGRYGSTGQVPIHYLYRNLDQHTLFSHYRAADVALVTPLRDGMNLVAHEYVVSRVEDSGVLILSEFAGAAEYLTDAILVNPYDIGAIGDALEHALAMGPAEAAAHTRALSAQVAQLDVHKWAKGYLQALEHGA